MEKLHSKKFIICFCIVGILLVVFSCIALSWNEMHIKSIDISSIEMLSAEEGAVVYIDEGYFEEKGYEENELIIRGWAVIQGQESRPIAIKVILQDSQTNETFLLPTAIEQRTAVTEHFADGINYDYSGFSVDCHYDGFEFDDHQYKILVLYEVGDQHYLMDSENYVSNKPEEEVR